MDGFFSFFGKFALILLVILILVGGGYYLGTGKVPFMQLTNPPPAAVTTAAPTPTSATTIATTPTTAPSPTAAQQTVTGGGLSGLSFSAYTITVPADWTVTKAETSGTQKISISKNGYTLSIYQAATGGAQCVYPGDAAGEMSTSFGPYTTISDGMGAEYRRATPTTSTTGFTVCQKSGTTFGLPTSFGHVSYGTPASPDPAILKQMDNIFATLKKV